MIIELGKVSVETKGTPAGSTPEYIQGTYRPFQEL
jgi:hypothetical protein